MKKKELIYVLVLIVIAIIAIVLVITLGKKKEDNTPSAGQDNGTNNTVSEEFVKVEDDWTRRNISSKLNATKIVDNLEISNISLTELGGISRLLADVENRNVRTTTEIIILPLNM